MILTGFCIFFVGAIAFAVRYVKLKKKNAESHSYYYDYYIDPNGLGSAVCAMVAVAFLLAGVFIAYETIPEASIIDKKIAMYEEENARIEATVQDMVSGYIEYESDVIDKVLSSENGEDNVIALVSLFPELNSDTLVQKQLDIYLANNEKIKELKAKKIELSMQKFILYFGN